MVEKSHAMGDVELKTETRKETGSGAARRMRKAGMVPCVLYGLREKNMPLSVAHNRLEIVLRTGKRMVDLNVGRKKETVLIKDLQHDPMTDQIIHADFERVAMDEEIEIEIPIVVKGRAKGQDEGGVIDQVLKALHVKCLPKDIPDEVEVDITELDIGDSYKVADVRVPTGVTTTSNADDIVVIVHQPAREEEPVPAEEVGPAEPEVIARAEPEAEEAEAVEGSEESKEPKEEKKKQEK